MNYLNHSENSAKEFGGEPEDYYTIHQFIDSASDHYPEFGSLAILHSSYGVTIVEKVFGRYLTLDRDKLPRLISVKEVALKHIRDELGCVPSVQDWVSSIQSEPWSKKVEPKTVTSSKPKKTSSKKPKSPLSSEELDKIFEDLKKHTPPPMPVFPNPYPYQRDRVYKIPYGPFDHPVWC